MTPFGIARATLDGHIIDCDDVYAGMMNCSRSGMIGRNLIEFTDRETYSPQAVTDLVLLTKQPVLVHRIYVRADGSKISCVSQICLVWNSDGTTQGTVAVVQLAPTFAAPSRAIAAC